MTWKTEPALIISFIMAVIGLIVAFGINVSIEQQDAIKATVTALLALLVASGVIIRSQVTPANGDE